MLGTYVFHFWQLWDLNPIHLCLFLLTEDSLSWQNFCTDWQMGKRLLMQQVRYTNIKQWITWEDLIIPSSKLDVNIKGVSYPGWYRTTSINYAFINPVQCHLGSTAVWSLRIICAMLAYVDVKCLHHFGKFNAFLDMFYCIKSSFL